MAEQHSERADLSRPPSRAVEREAAAPLVEPGILDQYDQLLSKLACAALELENADVGGRTACLEAASGIVFDLLYALDFRHGGELVPRLAALYGYIGNELLNVGRTGDGAQLAHLRDMITTLKRSWHADAVS